MGFNSQQVYISEVFMLEKRKTEIKIDFSIVGEHIDFEDITLSIGITPTNTREKEDYKIKEYAKDSWSLSTGYINAMEISSVFESLINGLFGKEDIINRLIDKYSLEPLFIVVIKADLDNRPEFILCSKCIKFASAVGADIHFDLYFY